jgi:signal transduction histidine kinase
MAMDRAWHKNGGMSREQPFVLAWVVMMACGLWMASLAPAREIVRYPLVAIADIRGLDGSDPAAFGKPVSVRGTVTWRGERALVVEDDSGAVWIAVRNARRTGEWRGSEEVLESLEPGVEVEIEGTTQRAGYSPSLHPIAIRITGRHTLPPAPEFDPDLFFTGFEEGQRIAADVVVQAVRDDGSQWRFIVEHKGRRFSADVEKERYRSDPASLVDSEVRIQGVAVALFNQRGEFVWPKLAVHDESDITVIEPPPASPFDGPKVSLDRIGSYRPLPAKGHRLRTEGTVIHTEPGRFFYLQEQAIGVRVETTQTTPPLSVGDRVEVAGFLRRGDPAAGLIEARYRRIGSSSPPRPLAVAPDTLIDTINRKMSVSQVAPPGDYEGCLVTFPARVLGMNPVSDGGLVVLATGKASLNAWASRETFAALQRVSMGSEVQVTGVAAIERADRPDIHSHLELPVLGRLEILLRTPADLRVVRPASWWTPWRLSLALGTVGTLAALATVWAVMLRRQVRSQLDVIESQLQVEAATEERKRIAQEFHDTLEQDLAGVAMRLDVAAERARDDDSRTVLESQRALLERLRSDTHDFLWDLRDPTRHDGSLRESLEEQVAYMRSLGAAAIRFHATGVASPVSPFVQHHLLRIVREAVTNAVKHGRTSAVDIRLSMQEGEAMIEIMDDGQGFDVDARGNVPGHFGIRGMRERARRINAALTIQSLPGRGTMVRVTAPTTVSRTDARHPKTLPVQP